ncbi:MAG: metal-dependent hydrolase [Elusimicrobiota bacterium]|nr:MAG: metal-dependent hydrolase [Elusimicrobiota bacterium]
MFPFGHAGPAIAAARRAGADPRLAALFALGPDLVDKPLSVLIPALASGNTRGVAHTALAAVVLGGALVAARRRPRGAAFLWGCWAAHLLLDRMWLGRGPDIFFWPLRGALPPMEREGFIESHLDFWYLGGEAAGLLFVGIFLWRERLFDRVRLAALLRTGRAP